MKTAIFFLLLAAVVSATAQSKTRPEIEYYVAAYAHHYNVPVSLVRAVVERESSWRACVVSSKGAVV
jgi:soluble lytic murein transglycosylase-like protein